MKVTLLVVAFLVTGSVVWAFFGTSEVYQGQVYKLTIPWDHTQATLVGEGKEWDAELTGYQGDKPEFNFEGNITSMRLRVDRIQKPRGADAYQVFAFDDSEQKKPLDTLFLK